ncbi:MAG: hypothetical protein JSW07_14715 [bacterium]|nr:MAG: hypothetical protein JSW07_14715 [bacterium]
MSKEDKTHHSNALVKEKEKILDLEQQLKKSKAAVDKIHTEMATTEAEALFDLGKRFCRLFTSGVVLKSFEQIRNKLMLLKSYDKEYSKKFGMSEPYGVQISDPNLKYFLTALLCSHGTFDRGLLGLCDKMVKTQSMPGNPLLPPIEGENIKE